MENKNCKPQDRGISWHNLSANRSLFGFAHGPTFSKHQPGASNPSCLIDCVCDFSLPCSLNSLSAADPKRSGAKSAGSEGSAAISSAVIPVDYKSFKATWTEVVHTNRERWRAKVPKGNLPPPGDLPGDLCEPPSTHSCTRHCHP